MTLCCGSNRKPAQELGVVTNWASQWLRQGLFESEANLDYGAKRKEGGKGKEGRKERMRGEWRKRGRQGGLGSQESLRLST